MKLVLILLALVAVAYAVGRVLIKKGKLADEDGNNIPDVVDKRVRRVKEEATDVVKATKTVVKQVGDIADAAAGKPRRGRKPAATPDPDGETGTIGEADKGSASTSTPKKDVDLKVPTPKTTSTTKDTKTTPNKDGRRLSKKDA